jgi:hypothetical protein
VSHFCACQRFIIRYGLPFFVNTTKLRQKTRFRKTTVNKLAVVNGLSDIIISKSEFTMVSFLNKGLRLPKVQKL